MYIYVYIHVFIDVFLYRYKNSSKYICIYIYIYGGSRQSRPRWRATSACGEENGSSLNLCVEPSTQGVHRGLEMKDLRNLKDLRGQREIGI